MSDRTSRGFADGPKTVTLVSWVRMVKVGVTSPRNLFASLRRMVIDGSVHALMCSVGPVQMGRHRRENVAVRRQSTPRASLFEACEEKERG